MNNISNNNQGCKVFEYTLQLINMKDLCVII